MSILKELVKPEYGINAIGAQCFILLQIIFCVCAEVRAAKSSPTFIAEYEASFLSSGVDAYKFRYLSGFFLLIFLVIVNAALFTQTATGISAVIHSPLTAALYLSA